MYAGGCGVSAPIGPVEAFLIDLIANARGGAHPRTLIAAARKQFGDGLAGSELRYKLDWLASQGIVRREPRNLLEEPSRFLPTEKPEAAA